MTEKFILKESEKFNIISNNKILKGWLLIVTKDNKEYLIKQNSMLLCIGNYKIKRKFYKTNSSLIKYKGTKEEIKKIVDTQKKNNSLTVAIGIVIGSLIRNILNKTFFYGAINIPIDFFKGVSNILWFWFLLLLSSISISIFRRIKLQKILKHHNSLPLEFIGIGYEEIKNKTKVTGTNLVIALTFFILLTLLILIVIPFLVELRLLAIILIIIFSVIYFNGNLAIKNEKSEFVIEKINCKF